MLGIPSGAFSYISKFGSATNGSSGSQPLGSGDFDASKSNAIYTDNGLILPRSISKQSYIIYK